MSSVPGEPLPSGGTVRNQIFFSPHGKIIDLTLDGEFSLQAGIEPQTWAFRIPWRQFAKLSLPADATGSLQFCFSVGGQPDYTLQNCTIVDVEGTIIGETAETQKKQFLEYRLHIADFRNAFLLPRGGIVQLGHVNPPDLSDASCQPNSVLINYCLQQMGLGATAPAGVDGFPPFRDLKWFGGHAPTELKKLLDALGVVFCPQSNGTVQLYMPGQGPSPAPPGNASAQTLPMPGIDRRGLAVVFTSAPNAIINRQYITGPNAQTWIFVAQDPNNNQAWTDIHTITALQSNPLQCVQTDFSGVAVPFRRQLRDQCYRYIMLNPANNDDTRVTRINTVVHGDGSTSNFPPLVAAPIAILNQQGLWQNASQPIPVAVESITNGQILRTWDRLLKLAGAYQVGGGTSSLPPGGVVDPSSYWVELDDGDLAVQISSEVTQPDPMTGNNSPQYFEAGFTGGAGGVQPIAQGAIAGYKLDPNTIIIRRPDWRLFQQNGDADNQGVLIAAATALAPSYLQGAQSSAQLIVCRGFVYAELSGLLSEIRIKQTPAQTTFKVQTWWLPSEYYLEKLMAAQEKHLGGAGADRAFPKQGDSVGVKNAEGHSGMVQPVAMVQAVAPSAAAADMAIVKISGAPVAKGHYMGGVEQGTSTAQAANNEAQPDGMTDPIAFGDLVANLNENTPSNVPNVTESIIPPGYYLAKAVGRVTNTAGSSPGTIWEIDSCRCGATSTVNLGTNFSNTTLETADTSSAETANQVLLYDTRLVRVAYNPSGDQALYGYYRTYFYYCGKLASVSTESRQTIFTTTVCS